MWLTKGNNKRATYPESYYESRPEVLEKARGARDMKRHPWRADNNLLFRNVKKEG